MKRKLIAAVSSINGGKDTLMNWLQSRLIYEHHYTMSTVRCRFADSLNQAVSAILGIDGKELQDRNLKEIPRFVFDNPKHGSVDAWSSRGVQKEVGKLLRDNLGKDVFINALDNRYPNPKSILLISDLRYQNELEWVCSQGGKVVYIHNEKAAQAQFNNESILNDRLEYTAEEKYHYPPESEKLQWDFYNKVEIYDYWLNNNDWANKKPFDDFVNFVVDYLEQD